VRISRLASPFCAALLCVVTAGGLGCHAQTAPPSTPAISQDQINHRIEVIIRSRFDLPPSVDVHLGTKTKSELLGYQLLPVTLTQGSQSEEFKFLVSDDNKTLARFDKYDLTVDPKTTISTVGRPVRGAADAPVTIVSFDDLECPYCSQMHSQLFPDTLNRYAGKVKFVYKDFPLEEIHPWALHAAVDANCLAAQDGVAYWNFVDYVHAHGAEIAPDQKAETAFASLDKIATDEGAKQKVNPDTLKACLAKQDTTGVEASIAQGRALNIGATPTLFINGEKLGGALPKDQLWKVIDRELTVEGITPPPPPPPAATTPAPAAPAPAATTPPAK